MATPNYEYEKRQRELAKKKKREEELRAKSAPARHSDTYVAPGGDVDNPAVSPASGEGAPG